jgi:hypothetical protein
MYIYNVMTLCLRMLFDLFPKGEWGVRSLVFIALPLFANSSILYTFSKLIG